MCPLIVDFEKTKRDSDEIIKLFHSWTHFEHVVI